MIMTMMMMTMMTMTMVMMLMINKDGQTSQEADLQSWPLLLHLRTAARTQQPAWTQYLHKEDDDDEICICFIIWNKRKG